jgi:hypothetical protein
MYILEILEPRRLLSISLNNSTWTAIGPAPISSGQTPGGLSVSGQIFEIAANPNNTSQLYAATGGGGVWGSSNGGANWSPLTDSQSTLFTGAIAVAPSNPNVIYAGTGNPTFIGGSHNYTGQGILKSTDGGATWSLVGNSTFNREAISRIVISPTDPNTLYAAVSVAGVNGTTTPVPGIYVSTNGGSSWMNTTAGISTSGTADPFTDLVMDPNNSQTLYCAIGNPFGSSDDGVYKTTNGGTSWVLAGNFNPISNTIGWTRLAIAANPGSSPPSSTIYAAVAGTNAVGSSSFGTLFHLYKSTDSGQHWSTLSNTPDYMMGVGEYSSALAVSPTDPNTVYAAGYTGANSVIRSTTGGTSWTNIASITNGSITTGPHQFHHGLLVDSTGDLIDADDGGAFRYDPPTTTWTSLNSTLNITEINNIALDPTNINTVWAGAQDNGTDLFSASTSWTQKRQNNGGVVLVDPSSPSTVYHEFSFASGFIERSDNSGGVWAVKTSGISTSDSANQYPPMAMDPSTPSRLIVGTNRVYLSTDHGDSWTAISNLGTATNNNGWTSTAPIDSLAISKTAPNTIYASAGGDVFVTTNGGTSWTKIDPVASPSASLEFTSIAIDPTNSLIAYIVAASFGDITGGAHVWKTTNGGTNWTSISGTGNGALPNLPVWSIALDPEGPGTSDDILYIGTDNGVYRSTNAGTTWTVFGAGLPNAQVRDLEFNSSLGVLAAGTFGRGVWEINFANNTPPVVSASNFNDNFAPNSLTFQFSQNVQASLTTADLKVTNRATSATLNMTLASYNTTNNIATFTFADFPNSILPDGDYSAVLTGAGITNSSGIAISSDTTLLFFHYAGDANHDRIVDINDFNLLAANFGQTGRTFSQGDFNYDGVVNLLDLNAIATRFGTTFSPPTTTPPTVLADKFNDDTAPNSLTFQFSQNVQPSLSTADLKVTTRTASPTTLTMTLASYNTATNTATFTFPSFTNSILPDGDYRALLTGAGITNSSGVAIQSDTTLLFFHFMGDANHDRTVDINDFNLLAANFGQTGRTFSQGDFNYDGIVNLIDLNAIATRYGTTFPQPLNSPLPAALPTAALFSDAAIPADDNKSQLLQTADLSPIGM